SRPVDGTLAFGHLPASFQKTLDFRAWGEIARQVGQLLQQIDKPVELHVGFDFSRFSFAAADVERPETGNVTAMNIFVALGDRQFPIEPFAQFACQMVGFFALDASHLQKVIEISLADALTLLDSLIKLRLSECWLVGFVVSSSTVA